MWIKILLVYININSEPGAPRLVACFFPPRSRFVQNKSVKKSPGKYFRERSAGMASEGMERARQYFNFSGLFTIQSICLIIYRSTTQRIVLVEFYLQVIKKQLVVI
jgi:hypothetical protein